MHRLRQGTGMIDLTGSEWRLDAACAQADPEIFAPHQGAYRDAVKICRQCPVQRECLDYAMADSTLDGVWGATTSNQRRRLRGAA